MGRFDFQSPGAAFTGEMTRLLAERKAEERQRLLDSLAVNADQRAAEASAQQRMMNEASLASQSQQDELSRLNATLPFMQLGQDVSSMPDDMISLGQRYGAFKLQNQPEVSTEITGMQADGQQLDAGPGFGAVEASAAVGAKKQPKWQYVGSPAERERERKRREIGNTLVGMLSSGNPDTKAAAESMAQMLGIFDGVPESAAGLLGPRKKLMQHDYETGKVTDTGQTLGPNDELIQRPHPPPKHIIPLGVDDRGNVVHHDPDGLPGNRQTFEGVFRPGSQNNSLGIPQGIYENLNAAAAGLVPEPSNMFGFGGGEIAQTSVDTFRLAASQALGAIRAKMPPVVNRLAQTAINDTGNYAKAVAAAVASGELNEAGVNQLGLVISAIVPPDKMTILKKYPPIVGPQQAPTTKSSLEDLLLSQK